MAMEEGKPTPLTLNLFLLFFCFCFNVSSIESSPSSTSTPCPVSHLSTYVLLASPTRKPAAFSTASHWYASAVASVTSLPLHRSIAVHGPIYTYQHAVHGFSARLHRCHVRRLLRIPGFLHAFPDKLLDLHTTHTPQFLHLPPSVYTTARPRRRSSDSARSSDNARSGDGEGVIVGVLDTGVWPERLSFADDGSFGAVPARWAGECETGQLFNASSCNNKLIGARAFYKSYESAYGPIDEAAEYKSARDSEGHGSHTASTAAGSAVENASLFGFAPGRARGMAPRARLAVYKVCWEPGCFDGDILAAFDAAVADGVDLISLSVGGSIRPFYDDSIALGAFGAARNGVLVSCSAGNSGPYAGSVRNVPPWVITVAASTVDRTFPTPVTLGDGSVYAGISLYATGNSSDSDDRLLPLVYGADVGLSNASSSSSSSVCVSGSLDPDLVRGKIVICDRGTNARVTKGLAVSNAGGVAMILANAAESGAELIADSHVIRAAAVAFDDGVAIKAYVAGAGANATATITLSGATELGVTPAPAVAAFSSRGPNPLPDGILKPDLTAPGVNILAAYTGAAGPTGLDWDDRVVDFAIMSGTSMSCPHVTGLAAAVKSVHPSWSPAAVKSALMTTASVIDNTGQLVTDSLDGGATHAFAFGAGHVRPVLALDPGLVYDIGTQGYIDFLCSLGYRDTHLEIFTHGDLGCSSPEFRYGDLNYPSFAHVFRQGDNTTVSFPRSVTNVGRDSSATYNVSVDAPRAVSVVVEPEVLEFDVDHVTLDYTATFQLDSAVMGSYNSDLRSTLKHSFGSLTWSDGVHVVRSPIAISFEAEESDLSDA